MNDLEVVVLGAGPAGCAAATLLARRSHRVVLVRPPCPPASTLAQSVPPSARRILDELGVLEAVDAARFFPNSGNTVWWAGDDARAEDFAALAAGWHLERQGLEEVLAAAAERAGVQVVPGSTARAAEPEGSGWRVECAGPGGTLTLRAPWLLDATGRHGLVARRAGRRPDRETTTLALVRRLVRPGGWGAGTATHTQVESYVDGWAWSVPLGPEERCVTAMVDPGITDLGRSGLDGLWGTEVAKAPRVHALLGGARAVGAAWACPASLYTAERFGRPGLLLVGDAGSFIDPLSSYGVKKALASGWLAAVAAHTALVEPGSTDAALELYNTRERAVWASSRLRSARYFQEAADAYGHEYWTSRARAARAAGTDATAVEADDDPAGDAVPVPEGEVRSAFETIKLRVSLDARSAPALRRVQRPAIEGYRVVRAPHLASDRVPGGVRFVRGVDLVRLVAEAPLHEQVPELWTAYNRVATPVTLPDFLTALATCFAAGFLEHAD